MGWEGRGRWREGAALKKGMERRVAKPLDCRHQCASEMNCRTRRRLSRPSRLSDSSIRVTASADRVPSRLSESSIQENTSAIFGRISLRCGAAVNVRTQEAIQAIQENTSAIFGRISLRCGGVWRRHTRRTEPHTPARMHPGKNAPGAGKMARYLVAPHDFGATHTHGQALGHRRNC